MAETNEALVQKLVAMGVLKTPAIIAAFRAIDRADFVRPEYHSEAYENYPLPIGAEQTISQPYTVAFMLELLAPHSSDIILDIGHGSGWQTALLALIVGETGTVVAYERIPELCEFGKTNIEKYNFVGNGIVHCICGDATELLKEMKFDKIIAAAAASKDIPESWKRALKTGGVIVAPIGNSIWRFTKINETEWREEEFPGFAFVPLLSDAEQTRTERGTNAEQTRTGADFTQKNQDRTPNNGGRASTYSYIRTDSYFVGPFIRRLASHINRNHPLFPILLFLALLPFGYLSYALFSPKTLTPAKIEIIIPKNTGVKTIADILKEKGIIRSRLLFIGWAFVSGNARGLREGAYTFIREADIPAIVRVLAGGEQYPNERTVVIPEGWNLKDMADYFAAENITSPKAWFAVTGEPRGVLPDSETTRHLKKEFLFLAPAPYNRSLEGYLFPDTYRIYRDATAEDIVQKMLQNFDTKVTMELRSEIQRQKKTLDEIITMASLIEKEVVSNEDRAIVSGILWKRLSLGIGLQVDATVAYITGKRTTRLTKDDLAVDSIYNTYRYRGLPPGPIANPGISAIRAALFPKESPYLYYLSTPDGRTIFSKTLEEHNATKVNYLR